MGRTGRLKPRPETPMIPAGTAMSDPVRNAGPVDAAGGFAGRSGGFVGGRRAPTPPTAAAPTAGDAVVVAAIAVRARRLLRERVLTSTRAQLELPDGETPPSFAESMDGESIGDFLGRLLSAQNQLASKRAGALGAAATRARLDAALRDGATEAAELLAQDVASGGAGVAVVAAVLEEYARRLAALVERPR